MQPLALYVPDIYPTIQSAIDAISVLGGTIIVRDRTSVSATGVQYGEYAAALERALNDVIESDWLEPEPRFYAAISVPFEEGDLAAAEIERRASNPR